MLSELFLPHNSNWLRNKFEYYDQIRSSDTAYWSPTYSMYVITKYDDVVRILRDPDTFSSAQGNLIVESSRRFGQTLGASDGVDHDCLKNIVKKAYSKSRIHTIQTNLKSFVASELSTKDHVNMSSLIERASALVTSDILGLPYDREVIADLIIGIQQKSSRSVLYHADDTSYNTLLQLTANALRNRELCSTERPGIFKEYVNNVLVKESNIKSSLFMGPAISGASSLSGALQFLILDLFRESLIASVVNTPSLVERAVDESLRFQASTGRFSRTVTMPADVHNTHLKVGTRVALCLDAANRDPEKFTNPNTFDLQRNTSGHVAFGMGMHACIALAISRACMITFLETVIDYFGEYEVVTPLDQIQYRITRSGNNDMITNLLIKKVDR